MKKTKICAVILAATLMTSAFAAGCKKDAATSSTSDTGISLSIDPNVTSNGNNASGEDTLPTIKVSFEENYDMPAINEMGKILSIHGMQFTALDYNFYYANEYAQLLSMSMYGSYVPMTPAGFLDLDAEVTEGTTLRDYLNSVVEADLQGEVFLLEYAQEKKLSLDDETLADIENEIQEAVGSADAYGITLDEYLQSYYGPEATVEGLRTILQRYELVNLAMTHYVDNYQFAEGEDMLPTVYHVLYPTLDLTTGEDLSEEEQKTASERAEALKASVTSLDSMKEKGKAAVDAGEAAEEAQYTIIPGEMVQEFNDWCFSEHEVGDIDIVKTRYGYHVMYYVGSEKADDEQKKNLAYTILQNKLDEAMQSGEYDAVYS